MSVYTFTDAAPDGLVQHLIEEGIIEPVDDSLVVTAWPDDPRTGAFYSVRRGGSVPRGKYHLVPFGDTDDEPSHKLLTSGAGRGTVAIPAQIPAHQGPTHRADGEPT